MSEPSVPPPHRTGGYPPPPPPRPPRRGRSIAGRAVLALAVLLVAAGVAALLAVLTKPATRPEAHFDVPFQNVRPSAAVPAAGPTNAKQLTRWSKAVAARTDIPSRAVRAYARAERSTEERTPGCDLSWTTVAGLGRVESKHGQYGGATLRADGTPSKPIVGVPLDGSPGVREIPDTDGGELDGDPRHDRAVGPMQFLPATWRKWGVRASDDGEAPDPQNIDDAAATAGRYLCLNGNRMDTPDGWWSGVLSYNNSVEYGQNVFSAADAYAKAAARGQ